MTLKCTVREPTGIPSNPEETLVFERCRLCDDEMSTWHGGYWFEAKAHSLYDNDICIECEDQDEHD